MYTHTHTHTRTRRGRRSTNVLRASRTDKRWRIHSLQSRGDCRSIRSWVTRSRVHVACSVPIPSTLVTGWVDSYGYRYIDMYAIATPIDLSTELGGLAVCLWLESNSSRVYAGAQPPQSLAASIFCTLSRRLSGVLHVLVLLVVVDRCWQYSDVHLRATVPAS